MALKKKVTQAPSRTLAKASTGIKGLDEITGGGLPRGRPTLVSGGAGVWSELQAVPPTRIAGSAVAVAGNIYAEVDDNGDGTGLGVVQGFLADGS